MAPFLKGPKPFAVVLCSFNDLPHHPSAREEMETFVSSGGRGGLFDYWRDVSYANIDLSGSEVFGWYNMKYSYARDGLDPLHDTKTRGRHVWIAEATRLCKEHGVDLSRFYGVIAVVNANVDDSSDGSHNIALAIGQWYGQGGWRHCNKCSELFYSLNTDTPPCPAGGSHSGSGSSDYHLDFDNNLFVGQAGWRWCNKCQALCFGDSGPHPCPGGGNHDTTRSFAYRVGTSDLGYPGQDQWKSCDKCQVLSFSGDATVGACAAGGKHDYTHSWNYKLSSVNNAFNDTFAGHETGHALQLDHSWSADPDVEYGDPYDIMSAMRVRDFQNLNKPGGEAGPGLNAPTLHKMGWIPDDRVTTLQPNPGVLITVVLTALNRPENTKGMLMARVTSPNHVYTVEFRQAKGWDAGIGSDMVLIHELRSCYTTGQKDWRWCRKCQGLAWNGQARCPAGALHNYAYSMNYRIVRDAFALGDDKWRWCQKCSMLSRLTDVPSEVARCPAGDRHDTHNSGKYTIAYSKPGQSFFEGQTGWKWCSKCWSLSLSINASPGICTEGGYHEHSGSADYSLRGDNANAPGDSQFRCCNKCQGLAADGYSHCAVDGLAHDLTSSYDYAIAKDDASYPGQDGWRFCWKCNGFFFSLLGSRPCAAGGVHGASGSGNYRLKRTEPGLVGQDKWKACSKCQLLSYTGFGGAVKCPAGGTHDYSASWDYTLSAFQLDRTYLVKGPLFAGQEFRDAARQVHIKVASIDSAAGTATVQIGF